MFSALRKTQLCVRYPMGYCTHGRRCAFAHSLGELRCVPKSLWKNANALPTQEELELRALYEEEERLKPKRCREAEEEECHPEGEVWHERPWRREAEEEEKALQEPKRRRRRQEEEEAKEETKEETKEEEEPEPPWRARGRKTGPRPTLIPGETKEETKEEEEPGSSGPGSSGDPNPGGERWGRGRTVVRPDPIPPRRTTIEWAEDFELEKMGGAAMQSWQAQFKLQGTWLRQHTMDFGTLNAYGIPWLPIPGTHRSVKCLECRVVLGSLEDLINETNAGRTFTANVRCQPWNDALERSSPAPKEGIYDFSPFSLWVDDAEAPGLIPKSVQDMKSKAGLFLMQEVLRGCRTLTKDLLRHSGPAAPSVFFWCKTGKYRSPAMLVAWLMWVTRAPNDIPLNVLALMKPDVQFLRTIVVERDLRTPMGLFLAAWATYLIKGSFLDRGRPGGLNLHDSWAWLNE